MGTRSNPASATLMTTEGRRADRQLYFDSCALLEERAKGDKEFFKCIETRAHDYDTASAIKRAGGPECAAGVGRQTRALPLRRVRPRA